MRSARREFRCPVVSETVLVGLIRSNRLKASGDYFVQCNQVDCHYVEANVPRVHSVWACSPMKSKPPRRFGATRREAY
jgi:hypothetical protein